MRSLAYRSAVALSFLGLLVAGCTAAAPGEEAADDLTSSVVTTDGLGVAALTRAADWGSGYCANVNVANQGNTPVTSWTVVIDLRQSAVSSLWNAASSRSGSLLTATSQPGSAAIPVGGATSFGFCANATGSDYQPVMVSMTQSGDGGSGQTTGSGATVGAGGAGGAGGSGSSATVGAGGSGGSASGGGSSSAGGGVTTGGASGGTCSIPLPSYEDGDGSVTWYTLDQGSAGAVNCSFPVQGDRVAHVATGEGRYFAAMNTADYNSAAACGACVEVSRDDGRKVVATVVDQCPSDGNPKCTAGHIDLSRDAFLQIGSADEGYLGTGNGGARGKISWKYVPCPVEGNISLVLKEQNAWWNEFRVQGHRTPIAKLAVYLNGSWKEARRQSYNYWRVGDGNMAPGPWRVRVTDVLGEAIETTVEVSTAEQPASAQFSACE
ncbi:expansin EXLX1 family cellulose-binding protein [Sorangium sp. So ce1153]|uniref:expansin EXLX1 family cellulose-binding protein n=1 Tax=Sorangium sp. So ce1153 TaxID=3133333 RepID=UPI003F5F546C